MFCVFPAERDDPSRDVLDLNKWAFYVTTTANLEAHVAPDVQTIGIGQVRAACGDPVTHRRLKAAVDSLLGLG